MFVSPLRAWSDSISGFFLFGGSSYYQLSNMAYAIQPTGICEAEIIEVSTTSFSPNPLQGAALVEHAIDGQIHLIGGQSYYMLSNSVLSFQP